MKQRTATPPSESARVRPAWPLHRAWRATRRAGFALLSATLGRALRAPWDGTPRRVLVVRDDRLGDALLALPLIERLSSAWPRARIDVLASPVNAELFRRRPELGEVLVARAGWRGFGAALREIRAKGPYDLALDLHAWPHVRSALLLVAARIPRRVGHDADHRGFLLTSAVPPVPGARYEVRRNLDLLGAVGLEPRDALGARPRFEPSAGERELARDRRGALGVEGRYAVLHPGTGAAYASHRRPALGELAGVAAELARAHDLAVLVSGGPGEQALVDEVVRAAGKGVRALSPPLPLGAFAALLESASLVVVPDTGVLHLAVAVGAPTVAMLGPKGHVNAPERILPPDGSVAVAALDLGCVAERCDLFRCPSAACIRDLDAATILVRCAEVLSRAR